MGRKGSAGNPRVESDPKPLPSPSPRGEQPTRLQMLRDYLKNRPKREQMPKPDEELSKLYRKRQVFGGRFSDKGSGISGGLNTFNPKSEHFLPRAILGDAGIFGKFLVLATQR